MLLFFPVCVSGMCRGARAISADPNQFQPGTFKVFLSIQFPLPAATDPSCLDEKLLGLSVLVVEPFLERESTGKGSSGIRRCRFNGCEIKTGRYFTNPLLLSFTDCFVCLGVRLRLYFLKYVLFLYTKLSLYPVNTGDFATAASLG